MPWQTYLDKVQRVEEKFILKGGREKQHSVLFFPKHFWSFSVANCTHLEGNTSTHIYTPNLSLGYFNLLTCKFGIFDVHSLKYWHPASLDRIKGIDGAICFSVRICLVFSHKGFLSNWVCDAHQPSGAGG